MASAWDGDWSKRIADFAESEGYAHIWDWLVAHPAVPLHRVAQRIGNIVPMQIEQIVSSHCEENGLTCDWMLDKLARYFHQYMPHGWTDSTDLLQKVGFFAWSSGFSRKYRAFLERMRELLRELDVPKGWLPSSKDDPHLIRIRDQALSEVVIDYSYVDPGVAYRRLVGPIWDEVSIYDGAETFLAQFEHVPLKSGLLLAAHWCQSEVCNGGLAQFFGNPTGVLAPEALEAFKAIGLNEWANVLERAMSVFGPSYPREQANRLEILARIDKKKTFDELNSQFFAWLNVDRDAFAKLADEFANRQQAMA